LVEAIERRRQLKIDDVAAAVHHHTLEDQGGEGTLETPVKGLKPSRGSNILSDAPPNSRW
jgi:hypothetical protein